MNIINQDLSGPLALCYGAITDSRKGVLGPLAISAGSSPSLVMHYRLSSFHLSLSPFLLLAAHLESGMFSESIVIGLSLKAAQGLSLYSPFWSPVIGKKPVNEIYLLGILLSIGYISVGTMPVQAIFWIESMRKCSSSRQAGQVVKASA